MLYFFKKDSLSEFEFLSWKELVLCKFIMICVLLGAFLGTTVPVKIFLPQYAPIVESNYFTAVVFVVVLVINIYVMYYFVCKKKNKSIREGFFFHPRPYKEYLIAFFVGMGMPILSAPVLAKIAPSEFYAKDMAAQSGGLVYIYISAISAPFFEELFYRGFLFPFIQSKYNSFWAVIATSIIFGLSHIMNIGNAHIMILLFVTYGYVLAMLRYYSNSVVTPIIAHVTHNGTLLTGFLIVKLIGMI